jgi:hypothetical protein
MRGHRHRCQAWHASQSWKVKRFCAQMVFDKNPFRTTFENKDMKEVNCGLVPGWLSNRCRVNMVSGQSHHLALLE